MSPFLDPRLLLGAALSWSLGANALADDDLMASARLMSADTMVFVAGDAHAITSGIAELDIARMLADEEVKEYLRPLFEQAPMVSPDDPVGSLLSALPIHDYVEGVVALGVSGLSVEVRNGAGKTETLRLSPSSPLTARLMHDLITVTDFGEPPFDRISLDFLLQIEPGPALRKMVEGHLRSPPRGVEVGQVTMNGRTIHAANIDIDGMTTTLYGDLSGDRWLIGGDQESFGAALDGGAKKSLDGSRGFESFRNRTLAEPGGKGNGRPALFVYVDAKKALETFRNLVPPILMEEAEILGVDSLRGIALGVSFVEGGVRESILFGMDGPQHGVFSLLSAIGGGFPWLPNSPAQTAGFAGLRFDPAKLAETGLALVQHLAPRVHPIAVAELEDVDIVGHNLMGEILPALGSEVSVAVGVPKHGLIPEMILSLEIRDQQRFAGILETAKQLLQQEAGASITPFTLKDGDPGFALKAPDMPIQPAFCIRDQRLYGAIGAVELKRFLKNSVNNPNAKTYGQESEILPRIMRGLNGGETDQNALLLYVDAHKVVPAIYDTVTPFMNQGLAEAGIDLDAGLMPLSDTLEPYLTGMALAVGTGPNGISIDAFTPTGLSTAGALAALIVDRIERQQREEYQRRQAARPQGDIR